MNYPMDHTGAPIRDRSVALTQEQDWELPELTDHTVGWSLFNFIESSGLRAELYNRMNYSDKLGMSYPKAGRGHSWGVEAGGSRNKRRAGG